MKRILLSIFFISICGIAINAARVKNEVIKEIEQDVFEQKYFVDYSRHQRLDSCISSGTLNHYDALRARILLQICYFRIQHYDFNADTLEYYSSKLNKSDSLFYSSQWVLFRNCMNLKRYEQALPIGQYIEEHAKYLTSGFLHDMASIYEALGNPRKAADYYWKKVKLSLATDTSAYNVLGNWSLKYLDAKDVVQCYQSYGIDTTDYRYHYADSLLKQEPYKELDIYPSSPNILGDFLFGRTLADTLGYYSNKSYFPPEITIKLAKLAFARVNKHSSCFLENNPIELSNRIGNAYIQLHQIDSSLTYFQFASNYAKRFYSSYPNKIVYALVNLANIQIEAGLLEEAESTTSEIRKIFYDNWGVTDSNLLHYLKRQVQGDLQGLNGLSSYLGYIQISERLYATYRDTTRANVYRDILQTFSPTFEAKYYHLNTLAYMAQNNMELDELFQLLSDQLNDFERHYFSTFYQPYRTAYGLTIGYSSADRERNLSRLELIGSNALIYAAHTQDPRLPKLVYDYALFHKQLLLESDRNLFKTESDSAKVLMSQRKKLLKRRQYATMWQRDSIQKKIDEVERKLLLMQTASSSFWEVVSSKELSTYLPNNVACIEFMKYEDFIDWQPTGHTYYVALLLRANDTLPKLIPLCEEYELLPPMQEDMSAISQYYNSDVLQKCIWEPLLPYLKGVSTIYFTGDGALHQIALEASKLTETDYAHDRFNLIRLTSTKEVISLTRSTLNNNTTAVLYGDIDYGTFGSEFASTRAFRNILDPLSYSEVEVSRIKGILKKYRIVSSIYSKRSGSEYSLMQISGQSPRILHFSTHGFSFSNGEALETPYYQHNGLLYVDPMERSGLFLSDAANALSGTIPQQGEDGILTAAEISTLDLSNTELVVLSACETALGDITSEGVWGLQRAFKMAGVQSVVMSLWEVDDEATAIFMQYFYEELFRQTKSQPSPHQALAAAQRRMRKHPKFSSPYYWAAFIAVD